MSIYVPPATNAVDFALTTFTPADLTPAEMALAAHTVPALNAVDFALVAYTPPTIPYVGWELLPGVGPVNYTLACNAGAYVYTGQAATLAVARRLSLDAGAYVYAGQAASLTVARRLSLDAGAYAYAGNDAVLTYVSGTPQQSTLGGLHDDDDRRYAPHAPWSLTKGLTPELREQIRKQLEAESEPVREVITAQAKINFASMEAEEKALQSAILAAQLEYDALYLRLVAYKRDQMEEEAIVLTMMSLL